MNLARLVRDCRRKKGLSVKDLAEKMTVTPGYISRIEVRGEIPSPDVIIKLAGVLGMDAEALVEAAKAEKVEQVSETVGRRFDEAIALYRNENKT